MRTAANTARAALLAAGVREYSRLAPTFMGQEANSASTREAPRLVTKPATIRSECASGTDGGHTSNHEMHHPPDAMRTQGIPRRHKCCKRVIAKLEASTPSRLHSPSPPVAPLHHKRLTAPDSLGESLPPVAWSSTMHRTKSMLRVEDTVASAPPPVLDAAPSPLGASSEAPTAGVAASSPPRSRGEASIGAHNTSRSVRGGPCSRVEIMPRRAEPAREVVSTKPKPMQKVTSHKEPATHSQCPCLTHHQQASMWCSIWLPQPHSYIVPITVQWPNESCGKTRPQLGVAQ